MRKKEENRKESCEITANIIEMSQIADTDFEKALYNVENEVESLSSQADRLDYFVAISSGLLCGLLDVLWVGDFSLDRGRNFADEEVNSFVKGTAKLMGCKDDDVKSCVAFLEKKFPIPSDGNTPEFGGGLQHHLRDFAHHPTIVGLMFSLLTQFTGMSYGTTTEGIFTVVPVPEKSKEFIGESIPDKLFKGSIIWLFHLVSDVAGSSNTAGLGGGTGIPGPVLSIIKELSALPFMKEVCIDDMSLSVFLSKLFNGTLFAKHDEFGKIVKGTEVKFDFRGELGALAELGRQALPVVANECIVRVFYFLRRFGMKLKKHKIVSVKDIKKIKWEDVSPFGNPTIKRMILVSSSVFTTIDITDAIISEKYFVGINIVGVGRFAVSLGDEMVNCLKIRRIKEIKSMYEEIKKTHIRKPIIKFMGELKTVWMLKSFLYRSNRQRSYIIWNYIKLKMMRITRWFRLIKIKLLN